LLNFCGEGGIIPRRAGRLHDPKEGAPSLIMEPVGKGRLSFLFSTSGPSELSEYYSAFVVNFNISNSNRLQLPGGHSNNASPVASLER
jgi:hypothetical protein